MDETIQFITQHTQEIDAFIQRELKGRADNKDSFRVGSWKEDPQLKIMLTDLKSQAEILSHTCVKFSLLINPKVDLTSNVIISILNEVKEQSQLLVNIFNHLMTQELGSSLFDEISQKIKSLFVHLEEMLKYAQSKDKDSLNYTTGMVTKIIDEFKKLPLGNKMAYRRFFMQKIVTIKETKDEFEGYLNEAKESLASPKETAEEDEEEEEEEDDGEDEEQDYSPEEVAVVEKCVNLFNEVIAVLKSSLRVMTEVADAVDSGDSSEDKKLSSLWVAQLEDSIKDIESQVIDLGAELYPPIVNTTSPDCIVLEQFRLLQEKVSEHLRLLRNPQLLQATAIAQPSTSSEQEGDSVQPPLPPSHVAEIDQLAERLLAVRW